MQTSQNRATRTFMDYGSISQAIDGIFFLRVLFSKQSLVHMFWPAFGQLMIELMELMMLFSRI